MTCLTNLKAVDPIIETADSYSKANNDSTFKERGTQTTALRVRS